MAAALPTLEPNYYEQLVSAFWSSLRDYSKLTAEARLRLAEVLSEATISKAHAEATAKSFEEWCPTPAQIRQVADNNRHHFVLPADPIDEWKRQGATHDPEFAGSLLGGMVRHMNGHNTDSQWAQFRYEGVKNAVEKEMNPAKFGRGCSPKCQCHTCKAAHNDRSFWAEHLAWAMRDHSDESAAARVAVRR